MQTKIKWTGTVEEEYDRFVKHKVFELMKLEDIPKRAKVLTSTWAMKKNSNGKFRARINMRGYEQIDGDHYDSAPISSPVTNDVRVRVLLVLMIMENFEAYIVDVQGACLHGEFDNGEVL